MLGHTDLIQVRLSGEKPAMVFVNDYPCETDWFQWGEHATVCTAGDSLSKIDFRCLVGLTVSISTTTETRAKALFQKAIEAGATTVAACHVQQGIQPHKQNGWFEIYRMEQKIGIS